jgi:hypothetical protein
VNRISYQHKEVIKKLLAKMIDQEKAEIIIPAKKSETGFWFGGGKLAADHQGTIWLSGRYRNSGDSRTVWKPGFVALNVRFSGPMMGASNLKKFKVGRKRISIWMDWM